MDAKSKSSLFNLHISGLESDYRQLQSMLNSIRKQKSDTGKKTTLDILKSAVSLYAKSFASNDNEHSSTNKNQTCSQKKAKEDLVITTPSAIDNLNEIIHEHALACNTKLKIVFLNQHTFEKLYTVECPECRFSNIWRSSPHFYNGKDLVTLKLLHGFFVSGMQKANLDRFTDVTGIGKLNWRTFHNYANDYCEQVNVEKNSSCEIALTEEIGSCDIDEMGEGIDIITDARHSTRRNSRYTDVVCVGFSNGKVLENKVVCRNEDPSAQRHELLGTKAIYNKFDTKGVKIRRHVHDRNASINKYVREQRKYTVNQNDTWHVSVSVEKTLKKISSGAKCRHGKTWSFELSDKVGPIKKHIQFALQNCNGDESRLKSMLDNIVQHYANVHDKCLCTSRCKTDPNYMPSRQILTDPFAKTLLLTTVRSLDVYKHSENYVHGMSSSLVESFNNSLNIFHDKRVGSLSLQNYSLKTNLAIIHWNENVKSGKKVVTHRYHSNILNRLLSSYLKDLFWRPF
jgi:hypothetical protein